MAMQEHPLTNSKLGAYIGVKHYAEGTSPNKKYRSHFEYENGIVCLNTKWEWVTIMEADMESYPVAEGQDASGTEYNPGILNKEYFEYLQAGG